MNSVFLYFAIFLTFGVREALEFFPLDVSKSAYNLWKCAFFFDISTTYSVFFCVFAVKVTSKNSTYEKE